MVYVEDNFFSRVRNEALSLERGMETVGREQCNTVLGSGKRESQQKVIK